MKNIYRIALIFACTLVYGENSFAQKDALFDPAMKQYHQQSQSKLLDEISVPLIERDSFYNYTTGEWIYSQDAIHQYYPLNCKDSVITYATNGINTTRYNYHYDQFNNPDNILIQTWFINIWLDQDEFQTVLQPIGCLTDYIINRSWNGSSWDTTYGQRQSIVYNTQGNPSLRTYTKYTNGEWVNQRQVKDTYNAQNQLIGETTSLWNASSLQFEYSFKDTAFEFLYYNSFCDRKSIFTTHLIYENGAWKNSTQDSIYYPDAFGSSIYVRYVWDGSAYIPSYKQTDLNDEHGNFISNSNQVWNIATAEWVTDYEATTEYIYGASGEIIRKIESKWNCSPTFDELVPCGLMHYYNFELCSPATAVTEPVTKNELAIYPNPVSSTLTIKNMSLSDDSELYVYNGLGKVILMKRIDKDLESVVLPVHSLTNGCYVIQIKDASKVLTAQFIKQ